ncbi:unnamed protein product [Protopolystoma xenopodis]|uniref:Uncharacterized protein n=1 Tax=Protopolystoma xenopodis TaxID=117903 RepID=A0A3S5BLR0_9PLAT|nr:unnamed protein product [Protopolystoma xenopodis]
MNRKAHKMYGADDIFVCPASKVITTSPPCTSTMTCSLSITPIIGYSGPSSSTSGPGLGAIPSATSRPTSQFCPGHNCRHNSILHQQYHQLTQLPHPLGAVNSGTNASVGNVVSCSGTGGTIGTISSENSAQRQLGHALHHHLQHTRPLSHAHMPCHSGHQLVGALCQQTSLGQVPTLGQTLPSCITYTSSSVGINSPTTTCTCAINASVPSFSISSTPLASVIPPMLRKLSSPDHPSTLCCATTNTGISINATSNCLKFANKNSHLSLTSVSEPISSTHVSGAVSKPSEANVSQPRPKNGANECSMPESPTSFTLTTASIISPSLVFSQSPSLTLPLSDPFSSNRNIYSDVPECPEYAFAAPSVSQLLNTHPFCIYENLVLLPT